MAAMSSLRLDGGTDFFTYLTTRTGAEMVQLVQGMEDPKAQAALTAALLFAPSPVSGRATLPAKAKKALNAFVGFRCMFHLPHRSALTQLTHFQATTSTSLPSKNGL
jgi:hypothetical protein